MQFLLIAALALALVFGVMTSTRSSAADQKAKMAKITVANQVTSYRQFVFVADMYMRSAPPAVTVPTVATWDDMKATLQTIPAGTATSMPPGWKIVRKPDNTWVACTEMEPESVNALQAEVSKGGVLGGAAAMPLIPGGGMKAPVVFPMTPVAVPASGPSSLVNIGTAGAGTHVVIAESAVAVALADLCKTP